MIDSEPTFPFLRPYVPDLLTAVGKLGQISAYYDANGHYARVQPAGLSIFTDAAGNLDPISTANQFEDYGAFGGTNFKLFRRCPGGQTQPAVDGSSPFLDGGILTTPSRRSQRLHDHRRAPRTMRRVARHRPPLLAVAAVVLIPSATGADDGPYKVRGVFDNGGFIVKGEEVRVAGATVGTVESVDVSGDDEIASLEGGPHAVPGKAVVVMDINDDGFKDFREDASCIIRPQSLIGEKLVDCTPTQPRAPGTEPPPELEEIEDGAGRGPAPAAAREQRQGRRPRPDQQHQPRPLPRPLPPDPQRPRRRPRRPRRRPRRDHRPRQPRPAPDQPRAQDPRRPEPPARQPRQRRRRGARAARPEPHQHHRLLPQRRHRRRGDRRAQRRPRGPARRSSPRPCARSARR